MEEFLEINRKAWAHQVETGNRWTRPVDSGETERARRGDWRILLTPERPVPRTWFPESLVGVDILCLASGGGQQGPILAAAGGNVTVFDYSPEQLEADRMVAERDGLEIATIRGDMRDLSAFEDGRFHLIVHPASNGFIDDVNPVWREAFRVLRPGGSLLSGFANPLVYIFDLRALERGELVVRHRIPYSDLDDLPEEELRELVLDRGDPVCFGHTLEDQVGGQLRAGFLLAGFYEDVGEEVVDDYIKSFIATRAVKPGCR